jgi:purine-nucleoside phosphorylase
VPRSLVLGEGEHLVRPCGGCRQRMREFAGPDTPVLVGRPRRVREQFTLEQLLPHSFGPENLKHERTPLPALEPLRARAPAREPTHRGRPRLRLGRAHRARRRARRIPYAELAGFPHAGVAGHSGELWLGTIGRHEVAVMSGRKHAYEEGDAKAMQVPLPHAERARLPGAGADQCVRKPRREHGPGSLMVVTDHINMAQRSPLIGESGSERFVDMVNAYDPRLRAAALEVARRKQVALHEGVYMWILGPQFETPAEIRMFRAAGRRRGRHEHGARDHHRAARGHEGARPLARSPTWPRGCPPRA